MVGQYKQPVQSGESLPIKAGHQGIILYLGTTRDSSHLQGSEQELISQTEEKSAAGDSTVPKQ